MNGLVFTDRPSAARLLFQRLEERVYALQCRLQYVPTRIDVEGKGNATFRPWRNERGEFLAYVNAVARPRRIIVVFHGNGGEALHWGWVRHLVPADCLVVLAEYPGYGARPGVPSEAALFEAADEVMRRVRSRYGDLPITLFGQSLGSGVACYAARHAPVERIALVSPFSSIADVAGYWLGGLPLDRVLRDPFLSCDHLRSVEHPLMVVHGVEDWVIPIRLGRRLFDRYPGARKSFLALPGQGHVRMWHALLHTEHAEPLRGFLRAPSLDDWPG